MSDQTYNLNEILAQTQWIKTRRLAIAQVRATQESPFPGDRRSEEALALLTSKRREFTMREIKVILSNCMLRDICHALSFLGDTLYHGVPFNDETWEDWLSHDDWDQAPR